MKIYRNCMILVLAGLWSAVRAQPLGDMEGIQHPSLAFYLASDSAHFMFSGKRKPAEINFRKMLVYDKLYDDSEGNIDTAIRRRVSMIFEYNKDSNLLTRTVYYPSHIPEQSQVKYYFNIQNRLTRELESSIRNDTIRVVQDRTFMYDEHNNLLDTAIYQYDASGRLIASKPYAGLWPWTRYYYANDKDKRPYLAAAPDDSTFFYYEDGALTKEVHIWRSYTKHVIWGTTLQTHIESSLRNYDKAERLVEMSVYSSEYPQLCVRKKYTYNQNNQLSSIVYCYLNTDIKYMQWSFEYNTKNLLVKKEKTCFPVDENTCGKAEEIYFAYDDRNNLVKLDAYKTSVTGGETGNFKYRRSGSGLRFSYEY